MKFFQVILLIASVVMFMVIVEPKLPVIEKLEQSRDEFEIVRGHGERLQQTKNELINRFKNISPEEAERLRQFLPDTVDNVRLLVDIDAVAKRKRLVISNISIDTQEATQEQTDGAVQEGGQTGKVSIAFTFVSSYDAMKEILAELEQSLRVVDARKVEVTTGPDANTFATTLTIDTYWLR